MSNVSVSAHVVAINPSNLDPLPPPSLPQTNTTQPSLSHSPKQFNALFATPPPPTTHPITTQSSFSSQSPQPFSPFPILYSQYYHYPTTISFFSAISSSNFFVFYSSSTLSLTISKSFFEPFPSDV